MTSPLLPEDIRAARDACLSQAESLLNAAKAIRSEFPNLAYVLASFALEEVGKAELVSVSHVAAFHGEEGHNWTDRQLDDHARKLFWALWTPSFAEHVISTDLLEANKQLAETVYERRLECLYVETPRGPTGMTASSPRTAVEPAEVDNLIDVTEARLRLAQAVRYAGELDADEQRDLTWFVSASNDRDMVRRFILSPASMKKLPEVGHRAWLRWLRTEDDNARAVAAEYARRELAREPPEGDAALTPKWSIKVRFHTNSHSIRPKVLNHWNSSFRAVKLFPVDKRKDQLLAELTLFAMLPALRLWDAGMAMATDFLIALNIGSMGFFWWYLPTHVGKFYEQMRDLETGALLDVMPAPPLAVESRKEALSDTMLRRVAMCLGALPRMADTERHEAFRHYHAGLTFAGATDNHLRMQPNVFQEFYRALKTGMQAYGRWDSVAAYASAFTVFVDENGPELAAERDEYLRIGEALETDFQSVAASVTLDKAFGMKALCDVFFFNELKAVLRGRIERPRVGDDDAPAEPEK